MCQGPHGVVKGWGWVQALVPGMEKKGRCKGLDQLALRLGRILEKGSKTNSTTSKEVFWVRS